MKKLLPFLWMAFVCPFAFAQSSKPLSNTTGFAASFTKVVQDFRHNYNNIQGEAIAGEPGTQSFKSTVCLPGAQHCTITRYSSQQDKSASWQAILYSGDNYDEALKAYKAAIKQVKQTSVAGIVSKPVSFEGDMQQADENVRFAATTLRLKTTDKLYQEFATDVALSGSMFSWEVQINVYKRKADTEGDSE